MAKIPSHYSLVKDHPASYEIHDKRDGKNFHVAKTGLSLGMHANLSKIQKFADGGEVDDSASSTDAPPTDYLNVKAGQLQASNPGLSLGDAMAQVAMTDANSQSGQQAQDAAQTTPDQDHESAMASLPQTAAQDPAMNPGAGLPAPAPQADMVPTSGAAPMAAPAPNPFAAQAAGNNVALQSYKDSILGGVKADQAAGARVGAAYKDAADQIQAMPSPKDVVDKYAESNKKLYDAYASKAIDPNRYWANKSTGSKISASLGLLFSGMGSATTGQPNMAMETINKSIDRDIDAQKSDQSKAMNLWKMNRENMSTDQEANLATKNQLLTVAKLRATQYASQTSDAQAKAKLAPILLDIDQRMQQNDFKRALLSGPADSNGQPGAYDTDPAQLVPMMVSNPEQQNKVYEEIGRAQNVGRNSQNIMKTFDEAAKTNTVMRTGAGMLRTPGEVMALHQLLLPNFKQIDGTVRQAAMDETFHNVTPAPGDNDHKIAEKRKALADWMHSETAAPIAKGNGIDLQRFNSTRFAPEQSAPATQTVNGVQYQKVQGGWARVGAPQATGLARR